MRKTALILLVLALLLVLAGCAGPRFGQTKEQAAASLDDTHRGTKGVTLNFVQNNPPSAVFTGTPLDVVVEVKNEGAAPVSGATVYLTGYDVRLFNIQPKFKNVNLEAKTRFNTFGGFDAVTFRSGNIFLPQGTDTLDQTFLASVCYNYRTEARIPVCVDPNPISILENEACRVTNPPVGGGQGAPVAVTAVREDAAPGQVSFLITIANVGDGVVVNQGSIGRCPGELRFNDVDNVAYSVRLSETAGNCQPTGSARLANKQGAIHCTFQLADASSSAYTTILEINLDYGYLSQKSKAVKIRSLT